MWDFPAEMSRLDMPPITHSLRLRRCVCTCVCTCVCVRVCARAHSSVRTTCEDDATITCSTGLLTPIQHNHSILCVRVLVSPRSAYAQCPEDGITGEPAVTSFHGEFKGTVDYIWFRWAGRREGVIDGTLSPYVGRRGRVKRTRSCDQNSIKSLTSGVCVCVCAFVSATRPCAAPAC
jgi:hypothetical protein